MGTKCFFFFVAFFPSGSALVSTIQAIKSDTETTGSLSNVNLFSKRTSNVGRRFVHLTASDRIDDTKHVSHLQEPMRRSRSSRYRPRLPPTSVLNTAKARDARLTETIAFTSLPSHPSHVQSRENLSDLVSAGNGLQRNARRAASSPGRVMWCAFAGLRC